MSFVFTAREYANIATGTHDREFWLAMVRDADRVLEIGCGSGRITQWLVGNHDYHCLDTAEDMVEHVRSRFALGAKARVGRLEDHVWDRGFDVILAPANVICHIAKGELAPFFQSAPSALSTPGRLVIDTFLPDLNREPKTDYVLQEYMDPADTQPITVRCSQRSGKGVQSLNLIFWKNGKVLRRQTLVQHMHRPRDLEAAAAEAGLKLVQSYGDYNFGELTAGSRKQIHVFS